MPGLLPLLSAQMSGSGGILREGYGGSRSHLVHDRIGSVAKSCT
jgi:hypothetical protein